MGLSAAYSFLQTDRGFVGLSSFERKMITKVDRFAESGTFTPPAGVTYAVAHITGGGGGIGSASAGTGGTSSVAFAGGTISATGGLGFNGGDFGAYGSLSKAGTVNSGQGGSGIGNFGNVLGARLVGREGALITAGGAVTAGVGITVTVGAGGTAGTGSGAAGGSGYVWIEYQVAL